MSKTRWTRRWKALAIGSRKNDDVRKRISLSLGAFLAGFPTLAVALDGEYVTYGGFEAVENAFRYIALFFSHTEYGGLAYTITAIGFGLGVISYYFRSGRDPSQFVGQMIVLLVGIAAFTAFILPKGNMNIYDPVKNATTTVAGVPDGIVLLADFSSNIQETGVAIANASSPRPYEDTANGTIFDLIRASLGAGDAAGNEFLLESAKDYFVKCVRPATTRASSGLTIDELKNTSTDLVVSFAKAADDAHFSTVFSPVDPGGTTHTCRAAWAIIQPDLVAAATYAAYEDAICTRADFDVADPAQKARCQVIMDEIPAELFNHLAGDRFSYMRASFLAYAMEEALRDINPERAIAADTNRRIFEQGAGFFGVSNEYGPTIRAAFFGATLTILPIILLFLATPFFLMVLRLFVGFFAFGALWSIIDIGLAQVAYGIAVDAFVDVTTGALAYDDLLLTPTSSVKALSVFGTMRFIAALLSALIVVAIFRISGASFAGLTSSLQSAAIAAGDGAANSVINPVGRLGTASSNATAAGQGGVLGEYNESFGDFKDMNAGALAAGLGQVRGVNATMGAGSYAGAKRADGFRQGGATAGAVAATAEATGSTTSDLVDGDYGALQGAAGIGASTSQMQTSGSYGSAEAKWEIARDLAAKNGTDAYEEARKLGHMGGYGEVVRAAAAGSVARAERGMALEAEGQLGSAEGRMASASHSGVPVFDTEFASSARDQSFRTGQNAEPYSLHGGGFLDEAEFAGGVNTSRMLGNNEAVLLSAQATGQSPLGISERAEAFAAGQSLIRSENMRQFAEAHGIPVEDIQGALGTQMRVAATPAVMQGLSGSLDPSIAAMHEHRGGDGALILDLNPTDMSIMNQHYVGQTSASIDETTAYAGGYNVQSAPRVSGDSLFNMAFGDSRGVPQFDDMIERAESNGSIELVRDSVSMAAAHHLSGISGNELSTTETGSVSGNVSAYGDASIGTPGPAKFLGLSARAGVRGSADSVDAREARNTESLNGNFNAVQEAFDRTIGNNELGAVETRRDAFFGELRDLDLAAHGRQAHVLDKAEDPDGILGRVGDAFQSKDGKENPDDDPGAPREWPHFRSF